jgi:hypothetical protein
MYIANKISKRVFNSDIVVVGWGGYNSRENKKKTAFDFLAFFIYFGFVLKSAFFFHKVIFQY